MPDSSKWLDFYEPYFPNKAAAQQFVNACEAQAPPHNSAKIIMHQAQRLISLAEDIVEIRPGMEPLQVFFLIVCAEAIVKLDSSAPSGLGSKESVQRFFHEFVPAPKQQELANGFTSHDSSPVGLEKAVYLLYGVRCDLVHEGELSSIAFHDGVTPMLSVDPDVIARISIGQLRHIVVAGCIEAGKKNL